MWRNKTVQALQRESLRREQVMQGQITQLLDRVMLLAGTPWAQPPIELEAPLAEQPEELLYEHAYDLEA